MADQDLDQSEVTESASNAPAAQEPDLEAQVRAILGQTLKSELDSRFSGFQSAQDRALAKFARELRNSNLSQDEQDDLMEQQKAQETAKALQIAELIKRRKNAPEAVDFLLESMDKSDLDEQIQFIQSVLGSKAASQVAQAVADATPDNGGAAQQAPVPDSDKNNPPSRRPISGSDEMNDELADTILSNVGRGQFKKFLGR